MLDSGDHLDTVSNALYRSEGRYVKDDPLAVWSETAANGFIWCPAIVLRVDKVVDDLDFAIRAKGLVCGFPQIIGDCSDRVGLFDPEPGDWEERGIAANQGYIGSVKCSHNGQRADVL